MSGNESGKHVVNVGHQRPASTTVTPTPQAGDGRQRGGGKRRGKMPSEQVPKRERIGAGK